MLYAQIFERLHDGFVDGIRLIADKTTRLSLREIGGRAYEIDLIGVERLLCNDFREGNIILSIRMTTGAPPDRQTLEMLFESPATAVAEPIRQRHAELVEREVGRIEDGSMTLVSIMPSYGCVLVALCREVQVHPV